MAAITKKPKLSSLSKLGDPSKFATIANDLYPTPPPPPKKEKPPSKPTTLKPISPARWNEMSEKAQWDIKVALRGPDCEHSEGVKWLTTSVIRYLVSGVMRVGGTVNNLGCPVVVVPYELGNQITSWSKPSLFRWNYSHFFQHVTEAAMWMGVPVLTVSGQKWMKAIEAYGQNGYYKDLEREILRTFTKEEAVTNQAREAFQAWCEARGVLREHE